MPEAKSHADAEVAAAYRLAAIVESSDDAIVSKDLNGFITTWNRAAERIFGFPAQEAIGQHITLVIPQDRRHEEDNILSQVRAGHRVENFETVRQRKDGTSINVSITVSPVKNANGQIIGASKIARDITEAKVNAELIQRLKDRYETLNGIAKRLASDLDLERLVQATTDVATRLTGAKFGAFFYNVTNQDGESYLLYSLSGAPREAFEKFGMPRNTAVFDHTFKGIGPLRSADIRKDPRYGKNAPHHGQPKGHLPVVSYLAVPVVSRSGDVLGGLFFGHDAPNQFDNESEELAVGIASHAAIAMDNARLHQAANDEIERRRRAEETKELLLHEIKHRVKNMLSTIDAVAAQTLRNAPENVAQQFSARIRALAGAHDLLTDRDWKNIDLTEIVARSLSPFGMSGRAFAAGPSAKMSANNALLLSLTFHELATNALKYGAWSNDTGTISVGWRSLADGGFELTWQETGGPPVSQPQRRGFGSTLIQRALSQSGSVASLEFAPEGVICRIRMPQKPSA
jgi:PAS domain S-box-containing protein